MAKSCARKPRPAPQPVRLCSASRQTQLRFAIRRWELTFTMSEIHSAALRAETIQNSSLYNKDLAPVPSERRVWRTYNYAALWISMSVNIPTYMLASGMIAGGMNWRQALFTVFLGNVLVLIPMLLNAHEIGRASCRERSVDGCWSGM